MAKDPKFYIQHILESLSLIGKYLVGKNEDEFASDTKLQDAVIRRIEIIGEAGKKLADLIEGDFPDVAWKDMIGMRNIVVHDYYKIDMSIIWNTAKNDLPLLEKQLKVVLEKLLTSEVDR